MVTFAQSTKEVFVKIGEWEGEKKKDECGYMHWGSEGWGRSR